MEIDIYDVEKGDIVYDSTGKFRAGDVVKRGWHTRYYVRITGYDENGKWHMVDGYKGDKIKVEREMRV